MGIADFKNLLFSPISGNYQTFTPDKAVEIIKFLIASAIRHKVELRIALRKDQLNFYEDIVGSANECSADGKCQISVIAPDSVRREEIDQIFKRVCGNVTITSLPEEIFGATPGFVVVEGSGYYVQTSGDIFQGIASLRDKIVTSFLIDMFSRLLEKKPKSE